MKLVATILAVMWLIVFTYTTAVLADDRDQKIEMLEELLEQYLEENRELKSRVEALERLPTGSAAAGATTCANDPTKCDDKVLCPLTVNLVGSSYIWSTQPAWIKYVQEAQKRGLNCPALANADRQENLAVWSCETNVSNCSDNDLCDLATYGTNTKVWKSGASQKFVDEARKRNLECGVASASQAPSQSAAAGATTCANDPTKCDDKVLCPLTVNLFGNSYIWSTQPAWIKYVQEAQKRGLNCPALANADRQENLAVWSCETNVSNCSDNDLCDLATYGTNTKVWKSGASQEFAEEAKKRGLTCGVSAVTSTPQKSNVVSGDLTRSDTPDIYQLIPTNDLLAEVGGKSCIEAIASWKGQSEPAQQLDFKFPMIVYQVNNKLSQVTIDLIYHPQCEQAWLQDAQKNRYPYIPGKCVAKAPRMMIDVTRNAVGAVTGWKDTLNDFVTGELVITTADINYDDGRVVELTNTYDGSSPWNDKYYKCTVP